VFSFDTKPLLISKFAEKNQMLELLKQVNWLAFFLHGILLILITYVLVLAGISTDLAMLIIVSAYIGLSVLLQRIIPKHHRMGFRLLIYKEYESAALAFQESWNFFTRNKWLDDYRSIFLLSASGISYREMSLINRSLCYWQLGNNEKALESYREVLKYFPESRMAKMAIDYIENPEPNEDTSEDEINNPE
jgi:tetratricopeptide (TPR) repeat protein